MKFGLVDLLLVSLGGMAGAVSRYLISQLLESPAQKIPWPTLLVNLAGSLAIGWLYGAGWFQDRDRVWLVAAVGYLGSLTTFSTFTLETFRRIETGQIGWALSYVALSLAGGFAAVAFGVVLGRIGLGIAR